MSLNKYILVKLVVDTHNSNLLKNLFLFFTKENKIWQFWQNKAFQRISEKKINTFFLEINDFK